MVILVEVVVGGGCGDSSGEDCELQKKGSHDDSLMESKTSVVVVWENLLNRE